MNTGEVFYYIPVFISLLLSLKQEMKWKNGWVLITISPNFPSWVLGSQDAKSILHQRADVAVSYRWWMVSLPLPYVIRLKVLQLFLFFLVSRSLELQKFLLSLYSSHQLFLLGRCMASTFECKTVFEQDVGERKQSEWAGVLTPPLLAILRNVHIRKIIFCDVQCPPHPVSPCSISSVSSVVGLVWS